MKNYCCVIVSVVCILLIIGVVTYGLLQLFPYFNDYGNKLLIIANWGLFLTAVLSACYTYRQYKKHLEEERTKLLCEYNQRYSADKNVRCVVKWMLNVAEIQNGDINGVKDNITKDIGIYEKEMFMRFFEKFRIMKTKNFLLLVLCTLLSVHIKAADGDTFTANLPEGVEMTFKIISESEKTCMVGDESGEFTSPFPSDYNGGVTIPSIVNGYTVTRVGKWAFSRRSGLTSVTIPETVTSIGQQAFNFTGLTSLPLPNSVTSLESFIIQGCNAISSIIIPASLTSIAEGAFTDCPAVASITVDVGNPGYESPDNCNAIIEKASHTLIAGCKNTTIPNSVTSIGGHAFCESGLTSISIPASVVNIGGRAFFRCENLSGTITIPNSVTSIGQDAFYGCTKVTSIIVENGNSSYDSRDNCNAIIETATNTLIFGCKNTIIPNTVTVIGFNAFEDCSDLTSINIPEGVTSIGGNAFAYCDNLVSVIVNNPTPIALSDGGAFSNRANATLYVPAGSKEAYEAADYWEEFKEIKEIKESTIYFADANVKALCVENWDTDGDGELSKDEAAAVTDLGEVFKGNEDITSFDELRFFINLESINNEAFKSCRGLTSVLLPNSITSIGDDAFFGCSGLTALTIPNNVSSIGLWTFYNCSSLESLTIPNSVKSIGASAFKNCSGLISVNISNNITSIGNSVFYGCSGLTSIIIPNNVTSIDQGAFMGCEKLISVTIPNGVTSISPYAFAACYKLTSVVIPPDVTLIGRQAFECCRSLTTVIIPGNVISIGEAAFRGCNSLTSVVSEIEEPFAFGSFAFDDIPSTCTLTVPCGTKDAYIAAGWTTSVFKGGILEAPAPKQYITFADANVEALCVAKWDTNKDGKLSKEEAAAVKGLGNVFKSNTQITSFNELQYFTGLTSINKEAFYCCYSLTSVTIPTSVTSIERFAFEFCRSLTSVIIPNSVKIIGYSAFYGCRNLPFVTISGNVTSIDVSAFSGCSSVTSIKVESGNTIYDSRNNCNAIIESSSNTLIQGCKNTTISTSVTTIGEEAFYDCTSLTSLTIPNSITCIGKYAFYNCIGLTSVTIPNRVTSISDGTFQYCI